MSDKKAGQPTISARYLRGLLMLQAGRCALTGSSLHPNEARADHIVPLSRVDLDPSPGVGNLWIVSRNANAAKGQMEYDVFVEMCRTVVQHHDESERLMRLCSDASNVPLVEKDVFAKWVARHLAPDGTLDVAG